MKVSLFIMSNVWFNVDLIVMYLFSHQSTLKKPIFIGLVGRSDIGGSGYKIEGF